MSRSIFAIPILILLASPCFAEKSRCDQIAAKAEKEQYHVRPIQGLRVTGSKRLYFHGAPDKACAKKIYVIPGDDLIAYGEWQGWFSVQYTSKKTGKISSGWVRTDRVETTGTMGLDSTETAAGNESLPLHDRSGLPSEVSAIVDRLTSCTHFLGEFDGDRSAHDKQIAAIIGDLRCETVEQDAENIRGKYAGNRAVLEALERASEL